MDLKSIRDELLRRKAVHDKEMEIAKVSCEEIQKILATITQEEIEVAAECGVDVSEVLGIDYAKLGASQEYRDQIAGVLDDIVARLTAKLEEDLGVSHQG